jgi:endonuclease/exonuclease/phosphatase family metal-dependent hydrolase
MTAIETGSFISSELRVRRDELRIVSWNIARGSKLNAVMEFLSSTDADIVFVQEADKNARRTGCRNIASEIAQKLKLHYVFGCEFEELAEGSRASPAQHGQATLSRSPLSHCSILRFQRQSSFWQPRWFIPTLGPLQRRRGGRMALSGEVIISNTSIFTYNLHCESKGSDGLRLAQLKELLSDAKRYGPDVPVVAAGDFNFDVSQGDAAVALADAGFLNPFARVGKPTTRSARGSAHDQIIDGILIRGPLLGTDPQVHSSTEASDHYPLSLTVSFLTNPTSPTSPEDCK